MLAVSLTAALALVLASEVVPVLADDAPVAKPTPWNVAPKPAPTPAPASDSALSLRVYQGTESRGPLPYRPEPRRNDDPAYAVDVTAVMTRCADGSLIITALVIGGQTTPLPNHCRTVPGATPSPPCDAKRWNCGTATPH